MYQYQVSFGDAVKRAFGKYCCFTGRASRSEYWWFVLFLFIIGAIIQTFATITTVKSMANGDSSPFNIFTVIMYIWNLIVLLPSLGLLFRRLHDTGRSGWNWCWGFLPVIGTIILIVFCCQESQPQENKYGPVPNIAQH